MDEVDILVTQRFIDMREAALKVLSGKHPYLFNILEALFANKENRVGLLVKEAGKEDKQYTIHTKGIHINRAEIGILDAHVKHPLLDLTLRPYAIIEKSVLEEMVGDDQMTKAPFQTMMKYLPDITLKFMR